MLVTQFVIHWRKYLSARPLNFSWLEKYSSHVDPKLVLPSAKNRDKDITLDSIVASFHAPTKPSTNPEPLVDDTLNNESNNDFEGEDNSADAEETEDFVDVEDMFADN